MESNHVSKKKEETKILDKKLVTTTWDGLDPLSAALSSNHFVSNENGISFKSSKVQYIESDFASWPQFKVKILNKFNTSEKLSIKSSFLNESTSHGNKAVQNVSQRVKNRLEQLDDFEENSMHEMYNLSQQEYVKRVDELNLALNDAWKNDQRVKALKIAIQCAKQLSTINVIHFYPSKFVLITDILDNFGSLVYNRIYAKTADATEDIHFAQETCRNWFYKISSIRELLPRFYIETSILHVYRFLLTDDNLHSECKKIFLRLTKMIRGIGNPLFAAYCRVYLCRVVIQHFPQMKNIFEQNIFDIFNLINQLICTSVQQSLMQQKLDYSIYYTLFTPALDWIFNCHFYKGDDSLFESVFDYFKKLSTINIQSGCSALILNSLITSLPSHFIVKHLIEFVDFIKHVNKDVMMDNGVSTICTSVYPKYILIKNIGDSLNTVPNLFDVKSEDKNLVIGEVWRITGKLKSKGEYVFCFETWAEIIAKYYDLEVINKLLGDIVTNLSQSREFENYSTQLLAIMSKIIQFGSERFSYNSFFAISNLMPYLDLFHKEDVKVEACKSITESFIKSCNRNDSQEDTQKLTSDPVILNSLAYICKIMHDSINALSLEDEKRQISILIAGFIRCVSFSRDFEAQLNFYVESRANFSNLDHVLSFLVQKVNSLAMQTHQVVKGFHTKKTISFVNACIAFSFITIPSIDDIVLRLQLYLSSSHIALINVCLPQTDAFLKSTITLLRQLPPTFEASDGKFYSNDEFLNSYVSQLLSTLIVVPVRLSLSKTNNLILDFVG